MRFKYLKESPFDHVNIPKTTKHIKELRQNQSQNNFYNKQQLGLFLKTANAFMPYQIYTFFRLLSYSGMRKGEILALTWADIDFINKTV